MNNSTEKKVLLHTLHRENSKVYSKKGNQINMFIMCFYVILVTHFKGNRYLVFIDSKIQYLST